MCYRQTGTYLTAGLLFPLLLALREVLLSEGNGQCVVPMLELVARQQGLKAHLLLREHLFYGKDLRPCRSLMFPGKLAGAKLVGSVCFNGTNHKACRSRLPLSILGVDLGDFLSGGFGELCRKVVTRNQLPLLALSS